MFGKMDAKKQAIEELMHYLDKNDDKDLGDAMKPKGVGIEVTKVQGMDGDKPSDSGVDSGDSDDMGKMDGMSAMPMGDDKPKMSDEELSELIEALQNKLGG